MVQTSMRPEPVALVKPSKREHRPIRGPVWMKHSALPLVRGGANAETSHECGPYVAVMRNGGS
jgi:hypothetical protein